MDTIATVAVGCFLSASLLPATPPECVAGTLATYIALGSTGCTVDGNVFARFAYSARASGGARMLTADRIQVAPMFLAPETARFSFSAPWGASAGQTEESLIRYNVALASGGTNTAQLDLTLGTVRIAGATGGVIVTESTNVGTLSVYDRCNGTCQSKTDDSVTFSPIRFLTVTEHVTVSAATLDGFTAALNRCYLCP